MNHPDAFRDLAAHYDSMMEHIDYERWAYTIRALAEVLPGPPVYLDAACGTGTLLGMLRLRGWRCHGIDLSHAMLQTGLLQRSTPTATADLRALPFGPSFDLVTSLFDSMNFLLTPDDLFQGVAECGRVLKDGGLLYFDAVTERMVLDHFAGKQWEEDIGRHSAKWDSRYSRTTRLSETDITVSNGAAGTIRERMYPLPLFKEAIADAGLNLLLCVDAETWKRPRIRTVRLDFVAAKRPPKDYTKRIAHAQRFVQGLLT